MTSDQRCTQRGRGLIAGALACALALAACADFSRGEPSPVADAGARPDGGDRRGATADGAASLSFATAVYPLLVPTCEACHSAGNEAGDTAAPVRGRGRGRPRDRRHVRRHLGAGVQSTAGEDGRQRSPGRSRLRRGLGRIQHDLCSGSSKEHSHEAPAKPAIVFATALVLAGLGCAQLEGDAGPTVIVTGPTIVATGTHSVVVGGSVTISVTTSEGEDTSYTFTSADPTIATVDGAGVVTGIATGETSVTITGDDTMATAGYPIVVLSPTDASRIPYYEKWSMSAHADGTAPAFNNWNADGAGPDQLRALPQLGGIRRLHRRRRDRGGRGRSRGADQVGDPLRHLPQPRRRRAQLRDVPVGRDRRRAGRRGALHDLPPGPLVGAGGRRRDRRGGARHRRHRQRDAQLPEHPLLPGRRHAVRRARQGRLPVRGSGLRRPLPPRRQPRHLHRLPRSPLDAGQVRRVRHLPHRRQRRRGRAPDPDDLVGGDRLRRRRQHDRGDLRRAGRPARQAGGGDPEVRVGARLARLLLGGRLPLLVRRRRRRRHLLGGGGGRRQRVQELDRAAAARDLQLPDGAQGSGRLRAQRQVHHRAAVRLDHRRQHRRWSPRST